MSYLAFFLASVLGYFLIKNAKFLYFLGAILKLFFQKNRQELNDATFLTQELEEKALSEEELFSLNIGTLEHERIEINLEEYNLYKYLKDEWGIDTSKESDKEAIVYQLQQLWVEGTVSTFMENNFLKKELKVKDLIAFDSARFTELLRQLLYLELMDEKEAWGLLFLNAQRVQDSFENAEDFTDAYFRGATFYEIIFKAEVEDREKKFEKFDAMLMVLKNQNEIKIEWLKEPLFDIFKINKTKD